MRLSDPVAGLLIVAFGTTIAAHARTFPSVTGQTVGPALFPMLIGGGLVLLGVGLFASGIRRGTRGIELDDWVHRPRMVLNFALVIVDLVFYAIAVDLLGFFLTAFIFLSVLMLGFGVKRTWIAPLAATVTVAMHYAFYTLLRVPLPWGLLEALAW